MFEEIPFRRVTIEPSHNTRVQQDLGRHCVQNLRTFLRGPVNGLRVLHNCRDLEPMIRTSEMFKEVNLHTTLASMILKRCHSMAGLKEESAGTCFRFTKSGLAIRTKNTCPLGAGTRALVSTISICRMKQAF